MSADTAAEVEAFVAKWHGISGSERANYQIFIGELCAVLGVAAPQPSRSDVQDNAYVYERRVQFAHGDGSTGVGFIDCYRRGAFVLEAKDVKAAAHTKGFDAALMRAREQAEGYARALPAAEGRPPFLVVVDVGHVIEVYAEFTRSGATYTPFPDARSHRIRLPDLRDAALRERLRLLWEDPMALDPARASAKVTRQVSEQLAKLARSLGGSGTRSGTGSNTGHTPEAVAAFLTRCLFSMFAEDVGLLPSNADGQGTFSSLLRQWRDQPDTLRHMLAALWADMDRGGFSATATAPLLRFNGKLFKGSAEPDYVLPLTRDQIDGLLNAAAANWREVEPSIFGTLLERALDPTERHALGAHYTPRAYVERLVLPTVVEPLRAEWADAQAAALLLSIEARGLDGKKHDDKLAEARATVKAFHHRLCTVRVLDPACGSGNFLYVTLEHLKRLEGEVMEQLQALGETQVRLGFEGETVTPQQLLGIEVNERAAALAELVLWIGYLQWHIRTFGSASVAEPVVHDWQNIECRDAVLTWDRQEPMRNAAGEVVTRWDGQTFKLHPVTGAKVPDERAVVPQWRYVNPRAAGWPAADFIVGNPPFIGASTMRAALGDGYTQALRQAWPAVPESADFVMYWWHRAAETVRLGRALQFGLITTNGLRQIFNRRVIEAQQSASPPITLIFALPDHPWVDSANGAAVRIAMTVGSKESQDGRLLNITSESTAGSGEVLVSLSESLGLIHANLQIGANVDIARPLRAMSGLSSPGVKLHGAGFIVTTEQARSLGFGETPGLEFHIRAYRNGRDLMARSRGVMVIDLFGLDEAKTRDKFPAVYQWLYDRVRPARDVGASTKDGAAYAKLWWLHGKPRPALRRALATLDRYVVTVETMRHRVFQFLPAAVLPDNKLVAIATDQQLHLGMLSNSVHAAWALATGGWLGVGNDSVYSKTTCFDAFAFPSDDTGLTPVLIERIGTLAETIDAHRKRRQAAYDTLTLTGIYNVLAKLRAGEQLTPTERVIHTQGLVGVLRTLHDDLDAAVLEAYGWSDLGPALADHTTAGAAAREVAVGDLLQRLVDLNAKRAAEEAAGTVRWLRPDFQNPSAASASTQATLTGTDSEEADPADAPATAPVARRPWPTGLPEQIKAVSYVLNSAARPLSLDELAAHFSARGRWRDRLPTIVATLEAIGRARRSAAADAWSAA